MSGGQEKIFSFLRSNLAGSRGLQCYGDKLVQIRIEPIDYVVLVLGPGDKDYDPAKIRKDNKDTFSDRTCAVRTTSGKVKALSHTALRLISAGSIRKEKEKTTNKPF